ncbi:hypothetical protein ACI6PS_09290 [Flavobacterium sp. PLA-1-15]|uniref:hypothetical protein n=1 Tax=Flavobacterium sp. PLA-1-15 TaxID=3380533 RepID=UPI003B7B516B
MLKKAFISIVFLFSFSFYGQNATSNSLMSIKNNFSEISIKAYQESAILKIEDYYNYLALFSNSSTSDALKTEIKTALFSLFKNKHIQIMDFTQEENPQIELPDLLDKIKNKNYSFSILKTSNTFVSNNYWVTSYDLQFRENENNHTLKCTQKVYFIPTTKQFGTTEKDVWTIKLGEIE